MRQPGASVLDEDGGEEGTVLTTKIARNAPGEYPADRCELPHKQRAACANAGKRLCTAGEWLWLAGEEMP